ncbi:MAG: hypothetical protein ACLPYS_00160 [Vulcanimicrobiaceae bacterium]
MEEVSLGLKAAAEGSSARPRGLSGDEALVLFCATVLCMRFALTTNFEHPDFAAIGAALGGVVCLGLIARRDRRAAWAVLALSVALGLGLRLEFTPFRASDVMPATHEALATLLAGGNPYAHDYLTTQPQHSIFPYLPGEIAFYALTEPLVPAWLGPPDRLAGMLVLLLIGSLAFVAGPLRAALFAALYATFTMAIQNSSDGGNDTALALLTCGSVIAGAWGAAARHPALRSVLYGLAAALLGWAICFKMLAWLIAPFVARWLLATSPRPKRDGAILAAVALLPILPFFFWNPAGLVGNIVSAPTFHPNIWGLNLWSFPFQLGIEPTWPLTIPAVMLLTALAGAVFAFRVGGEDLGSGVAAGCIWLLAVVLVSRWTTSAYYTYPLTVLSAAVPLTGLLLGASSDANAELVGKSAVA